MEHIGRVAHSRLYDNSETVRTTGSARLNPAGEWAFRAERVSQLPAAAF